jgi:small subunit ribosomal protein S17
MKIKELRESSVEELSARRRELKQEALNLRIQQQSGQLENPARLTQIRKEIARIETIITERSHAPTEKKPVQKTRVGVVTSAKMAKTIVVEVERRVPHPRFKKIVRKTSKFYAHDEKTEAKEGDKVLISETRPLSKLKRWNLVEVLKH